MDHRPSGGHGARRPGALAGHDGRNSWGPSWGLGRVLASSLLTSPPPAPCPGSPLLSQGSGLESRLAEASAPTPGSAQLATSDITPCVGLEAAHEGRGAFEASQGVSSLLCFPTHSGHSSLRGPCLPPSLCTTNNNSSKSNQGSQSMALCAGHGSIYFPLSTDE